MNAALIFTVPEPSTVAAERCCQAIKQLGAPLKSDSGHYLTGVITSGPNNVEVRVTWLEDQAGTQITISASHEEATEAELENVAQRLRYQYIHRTSVLPKSSFRVSASSILFIVGALVVVIVFVVAMMHHKS